MGYAYSMEICIKLVGKHPYVFKTLTVNNCTYMKSILTFWNMAVFIRFYSVRNMMFDVIYFLSQYIWWINLFSICKNFTLVFTLCKINPTIHHMLFHIVKSFKALCRHETLHPNTLYKLLDEINLIKISTNSLYNYCLKKAAPPSDPWF